jgi:hypothetical protein
MTPRRLLANMACGPWLVLSSVTLVYHFTKHLVAHGGKGIGV